jgi:hypothetical protein
MTQVEPGASNPSCAFSIDEATDLYLDGVSGDALGVRYGMHGTSVIARLRKAGVEIRGRGGKSGRDWQNVIIPRGAEIVESYSTPVTLRQLHYRLVSEATGGYRNTDNDYSYLSELTAAARREMRFPDLADTTRNIHRFQSYASPQEALDNLARTYNRDGQEGQEYRIYIGVEKRGIVAQLSSWFTEPFDIPVIPLAGYLTTPLRKKIMMECAADDRPPVLLYAGDLDPTGIDIYRHVKEEAGVEWYEAEQVALRVTQAEGLEVNTLDKLDKKDSRTVNFLTNYTRLFPDDAGALDEFATKHGDDFQVELDAIDPDDLRRLFEDALADWHDEEKVEAVRAVEAEDRAKLADLAA